MNAPLRAPEVPMSYFTNSRSILGTIVLLIIILLCFTHTDVSDYRQLTAVTEVQRTRLFHWLLDVACPGHSSAFVSSADHSVATALCCQSACDHTLTAQVVHYWPFQPPQCSSPSNSGPFSPRFITGAASS